MSVGWESAGPDVVGMDTAPLYKGLPDDRCQAHHWGYVIKGTMAYQYEDAEEVIRAGQVYYVRPGHIPRTIEPVEVVEFTRTNELNQTVEAVQRNAQEMGMGGE